MSDTTASTAPPAPTAPPSSTAPPAPTAPPSSTASNAPTSSTAPPAPTAPGRKARADGQRNRERLIETARATFADSGDAATASLEGIARAAGVGIGTLYRHFPSREALVEAVYESELDEVTTLSDRADALGPGISPTLPADVALRQWMDRYALFVATKRGMIDTLRAGWSSGAIAAPTTRSRINAVVAGFLTDGAAQGVLRPGIPADDVTAALVGTLLSTASSPDPAQAERLLDLLLAGLRS